MRKLSETLQTAETMSGKKSDAPFFADIIFKREKMGACIFSPAISRAYILICSAAQYQLGVVYLMWRYIKEIGTPVPKQP